MPITPDAPFPKNSGDAVRSKDWNDLVTETQRLDNAKVNRAGDTISGPLVIQSGPSGQGSLRVVADQDLHGQDQTNLIKFGSTGDYQVLHKHSGNFGRNTLALHCDAADAIGFYTSGWTPMLELVGGSGELYVKGLAHIQSGIQFDGTVAHIEHDGALYRNTDGQCYLTVDDNLYIRRMNAAAPGIHFNVGGAGSVALSADQDIRGQNLLNLIKFGTQGDYQVLHKATGQWGRNTLAFHCDQADAIGFYSTNWTPLLEVQGGTGNVYVRGQIRSPQFNVTVPIATRQGPLPVSGTFTSNGGTLLLLVSGSGWRQTAIGGGTFGMYARIDNIVMGTAKAFTNETGSHKALPSIFTMVTSIGAGNHTVDLIAMDLNTSTDFNDYFNVTVIELPFR